MTDLLFLKTKLNDQMVLNQEKKNILMRDAYSTFHENLSLYVSENLPPKRTEPDDNQTALIKICMLIN